MKFEKVSPPLRARIRPFLAAGALCLLPWSSPAAVLRGVVTSPDGVALEGVAVRVLDTNLRTYTDRSGRYSIPAIDPGDYRLSINAIGYNLQFSEVAITGDETVFDVRLAEAESEEEIIELEAFEVVSRAGATSRALSQERASLANIDVVAADEFGQLPDQTIAEALRRMPGVTVENEQGRAGRYVTIRGMNADFNQVTVNGVKVQVSNFDGASRSVPLDVVPAENADSIAVRKSALPSDPADAIGGLVDIRTSSAFDRGDLFLQVEGSLGFLELADAYTGDYPHDLQPWEFSAEYAQVLDEDATMGLALALNARRDPYLFRSVDNVDWDYFPSEDYPSDNGYYPGFGRWDEAFDIVEGLGLSGRFDWRPTENFDLAILANYTERDTNQGSQRASLRYDPAYQVVAPIIEDGNAVDFISDDRALREVRDYYEVTENLNLSVEGVYRAGAWTFSSLVGMNQGDFEGDRDKDLRAFFQTGLGDNGFVQGEDPNNPLYERSGLDAADYAIDEVRRGTRVISDEVYTGEFEATNGHEIFDLPGTLALGVRWLTADRDFDDIRFRYSTADTYWTPEAVIINEGTADEEQIYGSVVAAYGVKDRTLNGQEFGFMIDPEKVREAQTALEAAGVRDGGDANWYLNRNEGRDARANLVNSYEISEDIWAGFVSEQIELEKFTVLVGLRAEHTDLKASSHEGDFYESDPEAALYVKPVSFSNDYWNLFPHLHVRYNHSDELTLRFSVNQTMARPSYRQLNPATDIDPTDGGVVTKGNTLLDPVVSTNLDVSADFLATENSYLSLGVFYKSMQNNIYRFSRPVLASDPDFYPPFAEVREYLNADGADVYGLELAFEFGFEDLVESLVGLSLYGNYTYTESEVFGIGRQTSTPLFGQVPNAVNLGLAFERWGLRTSVAWNWTDAYLDFDGIDLDPNLDLYIAERDEWDLNASYTFLDNYTVFLRVNNLFDDEVRAYQGTETRMVYREQTGRSWWIGARFSY